MIVDDEPDVLDSTAFLVEALGYEAVVITEPAEILEAVEREKPDLLLQDLRMPGLNVAGLVAALRLNPKTAEVPLVFFSAGGDLTTTAARYDAWGYLAKPFGKEELARLLNQVIGPSEKKPGAPAEKDMQRQVRMIFHDYWNLLAALSNYTLVLGEMEDLDPDVERAVRGLEELILKLESKTDRLRAYITSVVSSLEPISSTQPSR